MDYVEAKWLLLRTLVEYRRCSYDKLCTIIGKPNPFEMIGASSTRYQLEIEVVWDASPEGDIRILASIEEGGWRAICPLTHSDLISSPSDRR